MATAGVSSEAMPSRRWRLPERLPDLGGGFLRVYQAIWIIAAILALLSTSIFAFRDELQTQAYLLPIYDAGLLPTGTFADGLHVRPFSPEAHALGIGDGLVVRINGKPAPEVTRGAIAPLVGPDGSRVSVSLRDTSGQVRDYVLTRSSSYLRDAYSGSGLTWSLRRWIQFAINSVSAVFGLAAATLLFVRRPRDSVAAMLSFGIVLNSISPAAVGGGSLLLVGWVSSTVSTMMILLGILFFPDGRFAPRWWPVAIIAILIADAISIGSYWVAAFRPIAPLLVFGSVALTGAGVISRYRASGPGVTRQQIKFAMFGFVAAIVIFAGQVVADTTSPLVSSEAQRAWLFLLSGVCNSLSGIAVAAGLLVALLRYRLYDAESTVGRSAAYGVLTLGFIALFAGAEKLAEIVGERYFEHSVGIAAGAIGAAVAAACIVPLHNRVHRWAERQFQKPLIRLREGLRECVADLRESAPLDQLISAVMKRVEAGVRSTREAVLLTESGNVSVAGSRGVSLEAVSEWQSAWHPAAGEHTLDCKRRDAMFPLRARLCIETGDEPETIGWLLLGPRPDGSFFGKDEREAVEAVAGSVARAIHIAQLREKREAQAEARLTGLEKLIARLTDALRPGGASTATA
jgi:GAF domain-containing protein